MKINIMTWNVDWFRNGNRSGLEYEYFEEDSSEKVYNGIAEIIKKFLEKENAVVFLQEVPYKAKGERWHTHVLYEKIHEDFPSEKYDVLMNEDFTYRYTMSISLKDNFGNNPSYYPRNNRTIAVEAANTILMGVHMPTGFKNNDDNDKMWKHLIEFVKVSNRNIIIVGDFNVFIGCVQKLTEERYNELLEYADNYVPENIITFGRTSIDKYMLNKAITKIIINYEIHPQEQKTFSDHKYICMELEIEE